MSENLELFDFSVSGLVSALLFGVIGMYLFKYGRQRSNLKLVLIAIGLMLYPYFTHGPVGDWGVGIALCAAAYYLKDSD
jgi:hypothetical protein